MTNKRLDLDAVFACDDQSALSDDLIANADPAANAWGHHDLPQSVLGRVMLPEVMTIVRGDVYTRRAAGSVDLVEHQLTQRRWTPWRYDGKGDGVSVTRCVNDGAYAADVTLRRGGDALLLLDVRPAHGVPVTMTFDKRRVTWAWADLARIELSFAGSGNRTVKGMHLSDDPSPLKRWFAGVEGVQINDQQGGWGWQYGGGMWIGVWFRGKLGVRFTAQRGPRPRKASPASLSQMIAAQRRRWETVFHQQVPALPTGTDKAVCDTYCFAWQMLLANRCEGGFGRTQKPFISPARLHYGSQWFWDEVFHMTVCRHLRGGASGSSALSLLDNFWANQRENGLIPGCLRFSLTDPGKTDEQLGHVTMPMQPPVIGLAMELWKDAPGWPTGDRLAALYGHLRRWVDWHDLPERNTTPGGLVEYRHCFEASTDQSPRWDTQKLDPKKTIDHLKPTRPIDGNVWMAQLWNVLGDMAGRLGKATEAKAHHARAARILQLIEEQMWHEGDGLYYDTDAATGRHLRVKTPFGFLVTLLPGADKSRVARMIDRHLTNRKEFWCRYPLPSVALDEKVFNPIDMWRGPTWINVNWMAVEGLSRHGYGDLARELTNRTLELVGPRYRGGKRTRTPRMWEWYHPTRGTELGNNQYGWTALVVDLILRKTT